jgi:hypothetical protein
MNRSQLLLAFVVLFAASSMAHASAGYTFNVTTGYGFSNPFGSSTFLGGGSPSPDTAFFEITNAGTTTFTGTIGDTALSQFAGDLSFSAPVTLAPGQAISIAVGNEASNVGGFNGPFGSPQPGVTIFMNGSVSGGVGLVNLSVSDSNIHSGVVNGSGLTDAYVLQGGNPTGADNGDSIEVSQAQGHFTFAQRGSVPEPASLTLFGLGAVGMFWRARRRMTR